ncbi:MAG: DUF4159 domain-containing protein [Myxococcales bacterium]|nr:DUF4159 domain-containing protein [Myxococcales bacterium]
MPTRRQFLAQSAAALTLGPGLAHAMGADTEVGIGLLAHGPGADARPLAVEQLMWEVSKRTSIDVRERPGRVDPATEALWDWPLVVWIGTEGVPPLSEAARGNLRRFLKAGGTLFIDDASPPGSDDFDASVRAEVAALWPDGPLDDLDDEHTLFRTFYLLDKGYGRIRRRSALQGVLFDDRSPILYSRNDLFGAFGRDTLGRWLLPVVPGGSQQREMAFRTGLNLVMYATCLNYKRDQVHTTAILRRRRWKADR